MIRMCQHNVLSSLWISQWEYSLLPCYEKYLSDKRSQVTAQYLARTESDVYCLCEVDTDNLRAISRELSHFYLCFCSHNKGFWNEWLGENKQWKPNGVAILLRQSKFSDVSAQMVTCTDGCSCCFLRCAHIESGRRLLIACVHLDNAKESRQMELRQILPYLYKASKEVDGTIICGDFNTPDVEIEGFADGYVGETTPIPQGQIDHTLVSGHLTAKSRVIFANPNPAHTLLEVVQKVCTTVEITGSDHFATVTDVYFV